MILYDRLWPRHRSTTAAPAVLGRWERPTHPPTPRTERSRAGHAVAALVLAAVALGGVTLAAPGDAGAQGVQTWTFFVKPSFIFRDTGGASTPPIQQTVTVQPDGSFVLPRAFIWFPPELCSGHSEVEGRGTMIGAHVLLAGEAAVLCAPRKPSPFSPVFAIGTMSGIGTLNGIFPNATTVNDGTLAGSGTDGADPSLRSPASLSGSFTASCQSGCGTPPPQPPPTLRLVAATNQERFSDGQTLALTAGVTNPGLSRAADFYRGIVRPDGSIQFFTSTGIVVGSLADPTSFRPLATGVSLIAPSAVTEPSFYTHQWTASDPRGAYVFFSAAFTAGALADGVVANTEILAIALAPFLLR